jgi:hypothetical protein
VPGGVGDLAFLSDVPAVGVQLAEMADPATREPVGNVPQALSHVGLITAARCVAQAEQEVSA